jgi:hypothetical protein
MHSIPPPEPPAQDAPAGVLPRLGRVHARRLRDTYRSAGWPCQDMVEIELLAAGLLERVRSPEGHEKLRLTDAGIGWLAQALQQNRSARTAHEALVQQVAQTLQRAGRLVWTGLSLRARLPGAPDDPPRWKICMPDVFSVRHTTVAAYLQPVVHEIKVSRADLLGDLKLPDKRDSYLDIGGQCWYVLGSDRQGRPIAQADEVPMSCGVMLATPDARLEVLRHAPQRAVPDLPFSLWMALARATPLPPAAGGPWDDPDQALLAELGPA